MNPSSPYSTTDSMPRTNCCVCHNTRRATISWGAIFAGTTAGLALQVLFMMLGTGLGLALYSPLTEENPVANLSIGALVVHSICAIASLYFGGWVAGRFTPVAARATGWLHGFNVWCAATVGGVILVAIGAGWIMGGLAKVVGGGLSAAGGAAEIGAGVLQQSGETITSYVDEAVGNLPADGPEDNGIRAKREIGFAVGRLFNPIHDGDTNANRAAAVTALVNHAGMTQDEAERTVADWTVSFQRFRTELADAKEIAAVKTRKAADEASHAMAKISWWSFVGFLLGALAASVGGHLGAKCATRCDEATDGQALVPNRVA